MWPPLQGLQGGVARACPPLQGLQRGAERAGAPLQTLQRGVAHAGAPLPSLQRPARRACTALRTLYRHPTQGWATSQTLQRPPSRDETPLQSLQRGTQPAKPWGTSSNSRTRSRRRLVTEFGEKPASLDGGGDAKTPVVLRCCPPIVGTDVLPSPQLEVSLPRHPWMRRRSPRPRRSSDS